MKYIRQDNKFIATDTNEVVAQLPSGSYIPKYDPMKGIFWFEEFTINADRIVNLPSVQYQKVLSQMGQFLKPETKARYQSSGFIYKRSTLLHGLPGTGKTMIVNRIALEVINSGGICLFVKDPILLEHAYAYLNLTQSETFVCVILEEFDSIAKRNESFLLTLLDGQVQKNNVMYLATTNNLEKIPKRLYRPGRINTVMEVGGLASDARQYYFELNLGKDFQGMSTLVNKTEGLSIDDLKEIVQAVFILNEDLAETIKRLKDIKKDFDQEDEIDDDYEDDEIDLQPEPNKLSALINKQFKDAITRGQSILRSNK